jgi:ATP-dependent protease ClpP protease subunit
MSNNTKEDWEPHINVIGNDIWYTGNITLIGVMDLIKELEQAINNKHVNHKINLFIGSDGGSVTSALMLYNYLNLNSRVVNIIGTNGLSSSGTYMLFTKCDTFVFPNIYALFHPMNFAIDDTIENVKARTKYHKHLIKCVNNIYLSKGFKCNWAKQDIYLFANDLLSKGIVDGIWQDD